ncbi:DUF3575 domain-containing protein [Chryseobacterium sp. Leaf394]|uniref:DUF3575 domain-containing protein n=1 Tax=Chryseobacterium sp. Leaf394 TaxID=1736361 RepID=UPI0006F7877F|nr:DUF3575 domain-containing protein [Chryseobacterium sp. Leaf394]KQS90202.1 hypothetical protein ASG21_14680 [Chryseobacterium sp. Leaf394]
MKKIFTVLTVLFSVINLFAQDLNPNNESGSQRKNDIVVDPILLIAVPMINISYERILNKDMGVGINAMVTLSDEVDDFKQFSPYFRYYMGRKYAQGFFFEGFVPVTTDSYSQYDYFNNGNFYYTEKKFTTVGVGFGVGGKWIIKERLVIEASGGIARRFGTENSDYSEPVTGKIMGGIGYRF